MRIKFYNLFSKAFVILVLIFSITIKLNAQNAAILKLGKVSDYKTLLKSKTGNQISQFVHKLPDKSSIAIQIKSSKKIGSVELYYGKANNYKNSNFYLKLEGNKADGALILFDQKKYYRYSSTVDGIIQLTEDDIDKVLCVNYQAESINEIKALIKTQANVAAVDQSLESLPGAEAVVYLDFDGQVVNGTLWNSYTNGNPIAAAPANLSESEMVEAWKIMSEDFLPFNINITTNETVFNNAPVNKRMRVIFTPTKDWFPNAAGGVAYIGSFTWGGSSNGEAPCWVWNSGIKGAGDCGSHEVGHTLNLGHDGRSLTTGNEEYFQGQGSWAPIMGSSYTKLLAQWSSGEYTNANNKEDDLQKITTMNGFGYRADDHGNTISMATPIVFAPNGIANGSANKGIISTRSDIDFFSFTTTGGNIAFTVRPHPDYPNLDIILKLYNSTGDILATFEPNSAEANLEANLEAGTYYLSIDGTKGTLGADSDYGSLGAYTISTKDYCIPTYTSGCTEFATIINNFSFNTLANNSSGCNNGAIRGYTNYEPIGNYTTTVNIGQSYNLSMQSGASYVQYFGVWIDYNRDKDFDDEGEFVYGSPSNSNTVFSTQVTIPATAASGMTRMRVRSNWDPLITSTQSCSAMNWGEAEDYTITVSEPVNQAPSVAITSPVNNATFTAPASISIAATASDTDGTISKVEFYQGATKLGEDATAPFTYNWAGVAAGNYALTAKATDDDGAATTSATINITVSEPVNQAPSVAITSPVNNATFTAPASISIAATASDTDGTISKVEFYQGATKLGEDATAPFTYNWAGVAAGNYALTAKATDDDGAATTSATINITVSEPVNQAPSVAITSPVNNATFTAPASISIAATASDTDGTISKVEFYQGATKLGEDATAPFTYNWAGVAAGNYALTAKATDDDGAATTSATINITVSEPVNQAPSVAITSPVNNATFTAPASISIAATASDTDGTISKVEFYQGATKLGEDATAPFTYNWAGVAAGNYALTAKATDDDGAATTSATINITVSEPVNQAPSVAITSPVNNATFTAPASISIAATASDTDGTISKVEFYQGATKLGEDATAPFTYNWAGVAAGNYALTAKATDDDGAATTSATINITVSEPVNQAPSVAITSPVNNATFTAPASISIAATASDTDGTISKVEFYQGATKLGEDATAPFTYNWAGVAAGNYALTAKATDDDGAATTSATINITVSEPVNQAPSVAITSPVNNATFTAPASISIAATASDTDGTISKVEFYQGATKLGEDATAPFTYNWAGVAAGNYALTAKATDDDGAATTSATINITVSEPVNQAPSVAITSPVNNATFTAPASISIAATASDTDGTISKVEFYQGATKLGEDATAPFTYNWAGVAAGNYALTAKATDDDGAATTSATINITVSEPVNQAPSVAITSPVNNATFTAPASISIAATASDTDGTISKVEFYQGATKLGEDATAPFTYNWAGVAAGNYALTAKATDDDGAATTSATINITVSEPVNQAPSVAITSPNQGQKYTIYQIPIQIEASASDKDGRVKKVIFFVGSTKIGEDKKAPYTFSWLQFRPGTYTITAKAIDNDGNATISEKVVVVVSIPFVLKDIYSLQKNEIGVANDVVVYPNPVNENSSITIDLPIFCEDMSITINDLNSGRRISTSSYKNIQSINLNVSTLSRGVYSLTFKAGKEVWVKKLVVL